MTAKSPWFVALSLAVAGCTQTPHTSPAAQAAGPGPAFIAPVEAGALFARACIETLPAFDGITEALASEPLRQAPATGTLFHQEYDLSFNTKHERCSMVFGTRQRENVGTALAKGTLSVVAPQDMPRDIAITSREGPDGVRYFRMVIPRQN